MAPTAPPSASASDKPAARPRGDMTRGAILPTLVLFALPMLVTNFFQQFYVTVDSMILGHWAGNVALAAVSSCAYLISTITCFFFGVSLGAGVVLAQLFGARNYARFGRAVWSAGALAIAGGLIMTAVAWLISRPCLALMNLQGDVLDAGTLYMRTYALSMLPMVIYNMGSAVFRSRGDSRSPMVILIISSLFNLALAYVFVAVLDMGVLGAALATALAQTLSACITLLRIRSQREQFYMAGTRPTIDGTIVRKMLSIGLPNGVQQTVICLSSVIISSQVNLYGIEAMDGFGAYSKIDGWLYMPVGAIQGAITTFVGQNVGARRFDRAKRGVLAGVGVNVGITIALVSAMWALRYPVLGMFSPDPEVVRLGIQAMSVIVPLYFLYATYMGIGGLFFGVGSTVVPMILAVAFMCVLRIAWVLGVQAVAPGLPGIYASYPVAWVFMVTGMLAYYRWGTWKYKDEIRSGKSLAERTAEASPTTN
ncbi:MAG: MATE family efflux transporter [Coriobacteriia bacterium]|nr:MATE family efflux transporter [Coriobacteriia bacterium]